MSDPQDRQNRPGDSPLIAGVDEALQTSGRVWGAVLAWWNANMDEAGLPARLRTMVRRRESWLVLLAILIGIAVAACQHKRLCSQTSAFSARII